MLERLCWQLRVASVLVDSDRGDWIGPASRETDLLADRLVALELARALEVASAAVEMGLRREVVLDALTDACPVPGRAMLYRHGLHLRRLLYEAEALADVVAKGLVACPPTGAAHDSFDSSFEELVREGALAVVQRVPPPSLVEFVLGTPD
ncbi:MAG: hypothetical protein ACRDZW_00850 [Acidimicrobiales bacterium]